MRQTISFITLGVANLAVSRAFYAALGWRESSGSQPGIAFNVGTDVELPGRQTRIPFLLLPQLESRGALRDGTDPGGFEYTISARRRVEL